MKRRIKLLSLCAALCLLCVSIIFVFATQTTAEANQIPTDAETAKIYTVGEEGISDIQEALAVAEAKPWKAGSVIKICFSGTDSSAKDPSNPNVLFGQKTIWREDGTKLPILIEGLDQGRAATIKFSSGNVACANDYTFLNLTLPVGNYSSNFFAGCGDIVFQNVSFGTRTTGYFSGDNFTMDVYEGWENHWNGTDLISSSLTFGTGTSYITGASLKISAVGYTPSEPPEHIGAVLDLSAVTSLETREELEKLVSEKAALAKEEAPTITFETGFRVTQSSIKPINTRSAIIIDTGTPVPSDFKDEEKNKERWEFQRFACRRAISPVKDATVELRSGLIGAITGDNHTDRESGGNYVNYDVYVGNSTVNIYGGSIYSDALVIRLLRYSSLVGDMNVNIGEKYGHKTVVEWLQANLGWYDKLFGNYHFNMDGGYLGQYWGGPCAVGTVVRNTITGGEIDIFAGLRHAVPGVSVANSVSGKAVFNDVFCGGLYDTKQVSQISAVQNRISGGIFHCDFYGGSKRPSKSYPVSCESTETTISAGVFSGDVYPYSVDVVSGGSATLTVSPAGELCFNGYAGKKNSSILDQEKVIIKTSQVPVRLGIYGTLFADEIDGEGKVLVTTASTWSNGFPYVILPAGVEEDRVTVVTGQDETCFLSCESTDENTIWSGKNAVIGARICLDDRISTKLYLDRAIIDRIENWAFSVSFGNRILFGDTTHFSVSQEEAYYILTMPSVSASNFHENYIVDIGGNQAISFNILDLCKNAVELDYDGKTGDFSYLAKSIYNLGIQSCRSAHGVSCAAATLSLYDGVSLQEEVLTLSEMEITPQISSTNGFVYTTASLVLHDATGLRFYGNYAGSEVLRVFVNGEELAPDQYEMKSVVPSEENGNASYSLTLFLKAQYLHREFTLDVRAGDALSQLRVSIPAVGVLYSPSDSDYGTVRALMAYIEAVYHYVNREEILAARHEAAWNEMYRMMSLLWTPAEDFAFSRNNSYYDSSGNPAEGETSSGLKTFYAGKVYSGIPYAHGSSSTNAFLATGDMLASSEGVYSVSPTFDLMTGSPKWARLGNDCNDAVYWAWAVVSPHITNSASAYCTPTYGVVPVGDYEMSYLDNDGILHSEPGSLAGVVDEVWEYNGDEVMYEALAALQPGDGLLYHIKKQAEEGEDAESAGTAGHVMIVQEIHVYRNADGSIDPNKSFLLLMDQTPSYKARTLADGTKVEQAPKVNVDTNENGWIACNHYGTCLCGKSSSGSIVSDSGDYIGHLRTFLKCKPVTSGSSKNYAYIPITSIDLADASPLPKDMVMDSLAEEDLTLENLFTGTLTSTYRISHVTVSFVDAESEETVKTIVGFGAEKDGMHSFNMARLTEEIESERSILGSVDMGELAEGERYRCIVTAQTATKTDHVVRDFVFTMSH